jgi:hypothetical protein
MAALELIISVWIAGDPADVGNADNVAVQVSLENTGAAGWAASINSIRGAGINLAVASGLDLGGLLQVLLILYKFHYNIT